jgi:hypothetical protein
VTAGDGEKLTDRDEQREIEQAVLAELRR